MREEDVYKGHQILVVSCFYVQGLWVSWALSGTDMGGFDMEFHGLTISARRLLQAKMCYNEEVGMAGTK